MAAGWKHQPGRISDEDDVTLLDLVLTPDALAKWPADDPLGVVEYGFQ